MSIIHSLIGFNVSLFMLLLESKTRLTYTAIPYNFTGISTTVSSLVNFYNNT